MPVADSQQYPFKLFLIKIKDIHVFFSSAGTDDNKIKIGEKICGRFYLINSGYSLYIILNIFVTPWIPLIWPIS